MNAMTIQESGVAKEISLIARHQQVLHTTFTLSYGGIFDFFFEFWQSYPKRVRHDFAALALLAQFVKDDEMSLYFLMGDPMRTSTGAEIHPMGILAREIQEGEYWEFLPYIRTILEIRAGKGFSPAGTNGVAQVVPNFSHSHKNYSEFWDRLAESRFFPNVSYSSFGNILAKEFSWFAEIVG